MWFVYRNTHAMTLVVVHEKNTHAMTLVDPCLVHEKNRHALTLGVSLCGLFRGTDIKLHWVWFMKTTDMQ